LSHADYHATNNQDELFDLFPTFAEFLMDPGGQESCDVDRHNFHHAEDSPRNPDRERLTVVRSNA
jgi:hypothetical protein